MWQSNLSKTKMTSAAVDDVTERLAQTKVAPQNELSFKGRGWKLDKAEDGECTGIDRTESHTLAIGHLLKVSQTSRLYLQNTSVR